MKRFLLYTLPTAFLLCAFSWQADAQYATDSFSFDSDISGIRESIAPDFHYTYDDWLQYGPAALMAGLKVGGYESRSSWGRMFVSDVFSVGAMAVTVNGLKYTIKRTRPDGSRHNSFPSGHTATAFMTATMLNKEYKRTASIGCIEVFNRFHHSPNLPVGFVYFRKNKQMRGNNV